MNKALHRVAGGLILALPMALAIAACAPTKQVTDFQIAEGFLPDPSLLKSGQSGQAAYVYMNPDANMHDYHSILLEPVTVWTAPGTAMDRSPPEQRQAWANDLYSRLYNKISQRCQMVNAPGPGVMRIRVALVDVERSNPVANTASTYIPQARVLSTLAAYAFNDGIGVFTGSANAEAYATDAENGTVLWQVADKRAGANAIGTNTLNSWSDVENTFDAWSEQFANRLVALGACPQSQ